MTTPNATGFDAVSGRALYVLRAVWSEGLPSKLNLGCRYFICLVAADTTQVPVDEQLALLSRLFELGCVYLLTWGPGCEELHDLADEILANQQEMAGERDLVLTTWHTNEPLTEALWKALFCAWPADAYFDDCRALLALCMAPGEWLDVCRQALCDPTGFSRSILGAD